jgi:uncharacterized protein (TIGR02145 family)
MRSCFALLLVFFSLAGSVSAQDTVEVKAGWNIIGSVKAGAVPDVLSTIPDSIIATAFFGYNPGAGYQSTDTLGKGLGYWVKVNSDGLLIFDTENLSPGACGVLRVLYDSKIYHTVKIGDQCWMEENLNIGMMVTGVTAQADNATPEKYCYGDDPLNCALYGGLYQWDEAMQYVTTPGAQGLCPSGWHIPTSAEFQTLSASVGGDGNALKAVGQGFSGGAGTNTSGFSALLAGYRSALGNFNVLLTNAAFWSSTENIPNASNLDLNYTDAVVGAFNLTKSNGYSLRCIAD